MREREMTAVRIELTLSLCRSGALPLDYAVEKLKWIAMQQDNKKKQIEVEVEVEK